MLAVVAALLAVTAGCLGAAQSTAPTASPADEASTITVSAAGEVSADPDLAVVRVAVVATAETADDARAAVAEDAARMREALRDLGIADEGIRTSFFHIGPQYDHTKDGRELIGYRAVHAFEIESGVDEAGAVIDAAVANGADRVDGVTFTLSDAARADLRAEALALAVENARADANTIANAADVEVTGVRSVSTSNGGFVPFDARLEGAADAPTTLEPGPVTVSAHVTVVYTI